MPLIQYNYINVNVFIYNIIKFIFEVSKCCWGHCRCTLTIHCDIRWLIRLCACVCLSVFVYFWTSDSSDKLRQPKIGALMKQVMGAKEDVPGTFSRGGESSLCFRCYTQSCQDLAIFSYVFSHL